MKAHKVGWLEYFMDIAEMVSRRGTCDRKRVGCVMVKDRRILATGYNGSMSGAEHCDDAGHMMEEGHCIRTVHAETNAIAACARHGISCDGASIYINTLPCWICFKILVNSGIKHIYYRDDYPASNKDKVFDHAARVDVSITKVE